jgi:hypothetical protein
MESTIGMSVKLTLQAAGNCSACGAPVYAGVYHLCGQPDRRGGPDGAVVEVTPAHIPASDAGFLTYPPELTVSKGRTSCERCGDEVKPNVYHQCPPVSAANGRDHE